MAKDNLNYVPSTPKTYEVRYIENKKSSLSPAARSKVINKSGSNYLSERTGEINPSYGPMPANSSNSFTLTISIREGTCNQYAYAFETSGTTFSTCTLGSADEAIMWVVKLNKGEVKVVDTKQNNERNTDLEERIKKDINKKLAEFLLEDLKEGEGRDYHLHYSYSRIA